MVIIAALRIVIQNTYEVFHSFVIFNIIRRDNGTKLAQLLYVLSSKSSPFQFCPPFFKIQHFHFFKQNSIFSVFSTNYVLAKLKKDLDLSLGAFKVQTNFG